MSTEVNLTPEASACFIAGRMPGPSDKAAARAAIGAGPDMGSADPVGWYGIRMAEGSLVTVGVFGDSTHWGYLAGGAQASPTPVATCQSALRSYYRQTNPATQVVFVNNAVNAKGTTYGIGIWGPAMAALPAASMVWIAYGTNDATGLVAEETKAVDAYAANLRTLVLDARAAGHTPVLETPLPLLPYGALGNMERSERLKHFVQAMRGVAAELSVPLLDTYAHFERQLQMPSSPSLLFSDGIHLTQAGYDLRGMFMANFIMRATVLPRQAVLKATDPPIRHYGGTNAVLSTPGSVTGWGRVASAIRIPVEIRDPGTDLYVATPVWVSGATTATIKRNGVTVWTGSLAGAALTADSFAVDHWLMAGENLSPGVYLIEMDGVSGGSGDTGLYAGMTTPTRAAPATPIGTVTATRLLGDFAFTSPVSGTGFNHALSEFPLSNSLRQVGMECTAKLAGNQGIVLHGTGRTSAAQPWGGVLIFLHGTTGYLTAGTGLQGYLADGTTLPSDYALTTLGSTDLRGADHVYRMVCKTNGDVACYVDGTLIGTYTPTIPYRGGRIGAYTYGASTTVELRGIKVF